MFMTPSLATAAYIAAIILFIMSLGGLSHPETWRRGNLYGIIGMAIAVLATIFGPRVSSLFLTSTKKRYKIEGICALFFLFKSFCEYYFIS